MSDAEDAASNKTDNDDHDEVSIAWSSYQPADDSLIYKKQAMTLQEPYYGKL